MGGQGVACLGDGPLVPMQIPLCGGQRAVPGDLPQDVHRNAGISHPGQPGVPQVRKVDRLSCVRFGSARYSVPTRLIGRPVAVAESGGRLLITDPATGDMSHQVLVAELGDDFIPMGRVPLSDPDTQFHDLGSGFYASRIDPDRRKRNHIRQLEALGYTVTIQPAA